MASVANLLESLLARRDFNQREAQTFMEILISGSLSDAQIAGLLIALRAKGCSGEELAGFASVMRSQSNSLEHEHPTLVDTCGTGGGIPSFNLSTAAAFVAAGAGVRIAKHGNRAVTSSCGSSDVLEALGVDLSLDSAHLKKSLDEIGIAFLFAPNHHPAFAKIGAVRKDLGVRTVMNQLGPLANPANARRQLIGVYDRAMLDPMADALRRLGCERGIIAYSSDGLDEVSPVGTTSLAILEGGVVRIQVVLPADFGIEPLATEHLAPGATLSENAAILREAITDVDSPRAQAVIPNAACAIWLAGLAEEFKQAAQIAMESIRSGSALLRLDRLAALRGDKA